MKQTAVECLEKEIKEIISYIEEDGMYAMKGAEERLFGECNIFYKAKEMEKQQIQDAYRISPNNELWSKSGIDYYEKTFKNK